VLLPIVYEGDDEARVFVVLDVKIDGDDVLFNPIDSLLVVWLV
jgi:hypothetical protein